MPVTALALFGFLEQVPAASWLRGVCVLPGQSDSEVLALWQTAKGALGVPTGNAGFPEILPLPPEGVGYVTTLTTQQWVAERLHGIPAPKGIDFCLVEIDPLLAYQVHVDQDRSRAHGHGVPAAPTLDQLLSVCLPMAQPSEALRVDQAPGSMMISSKSLNFRTLWQGFAQTGFLGIHVGVSLPFAHVVRFNGRCYLHNGFHRAVALRGLGATHIPCIFRDVDTPQDAGIGAPGAFSQQLLESADPPTLFHFTSGRATEVQMKRFHRVLHISWAEYGTTIDD